MRRHVDSEINPEHPSENLLFVNVISESLGDGVDLTSNLLLDLFVLKIVVSLLIATKSCTLFGQFGMADNLGVQWAN